MTATGATPDAPDHVGAQGAMPPELDNPTDPPAPQDPPAPPAPPAPTPPPADEPLGEAGKRALDAERRARAEADRKAKAAEDELAKIREAQMSDQEKAVEQARRDAESATTAKFLGRLFASEVRTAAVGKLADPDLLADPEVALRLLGLDKFPVTSTGDIDSAAIVESLDAFVKARPKLAATSSGGATPPPGDPGRGPRGGDQPAQLTDADLKRMTPEQIVEARRAGRLSALLGGR